MVQSESTNKPPELELDYVNKGDARILYHWNSDETSWTNSITVERNEITYYQYEERVIHWTIPDPFEIDGQLVDLNTFDDAETFIAANATEIIRFAKGSTKTLIK